eukprot:5555040-Alexandrium_andersonii.AAC.1
MSASLVGSEMCIRDRLRQDAADGGLPMQQAPPADGGNTGRDTTIDYGGHCLLYTSDAADDM